MIEIILIGSLATLAPAGLAAIWWYWRKPAWMGFADKTLWDWATILAIPTGVGLASLGISAVQIALERDAAQEAAVQAYFDRIGTLAPLLDESGPHVDRSLVIGRAQTAAVLRVVDGERAGRILTFLHEAGLLGAFVDSLEGLDLGGARMKGLNLDGVDLEDAILRGADLEKSRLREADFEHADLRGTDLKHTDLRGADFEGTRINGAELHGADLRGADLSLAVGLRARQLANACLDATTLLPAGLLAVGNPEACLSGFADAQPDADKD